MVAEASPEYGVTDLEALRHEYRKARKRGEDMEREMKALSVHQPFVAGRTRSPAPACPPTISTELQLGS